MPEIKDQGHKAVPPTPATSHAGYRPGPEHVAKQSQTRVFKGLSSLFEWLTELRVIIRIYLLACYKEYFRELDEKSDDA